MIPTASEVRALLNTLEADAVAEAALVGDRAPIDEAALRRVLTEAWGGALRGILSVMNAAGIGPDADRDGTISERELNTYLEILRYAVAVAFAAPALGHVASRLRDTYRQAARQEASEIELAFSLRTPDRLAQATVARTHAHWVTAYGQRHLEPRIADAVQAMLTAETTRAEAADGLRQLVGKVYQHGMNYWDLVVSNAVTDAREMARISVYAESGLEEVYLSTVRDRRRSEVCNLLKSRAYRVRDLTAYRDARLAAPTPEAAMSVAPMWTDKDVPILRRMVRSAGGRIPGSIGPPPLHHRCRSRLVARQPAEPVTPI
ncbi:MAG: hypothetical protein AAF170_16575 [Bacteroidota bacterium]